jgi:hypothetical protein
MHRPCLGSQYSGWNRSYYSTPEQLHKLIRALPIPTAQLPARLAHSLSLIVSFSLGLRFRQQDRIPSRLLCPVAFPASWGGVNHMPPHEATLDANRCPFRVTFVQVSRSGFTSLGGSAPTFRVSTQQGPTCTMKWPAIWGP